jgi:hypothetical protein
MKRLAREHVASRNKDLMPSGFNQHIILTRYSESFSHHCRA